MPESFQTLSIEARPVPRLKVWQDWPGEQIFFLDGRVVLAKKWLGCLGTFAVMIVPVGLFLGLVAPKLDEPVNYVAVIVECALAAAASAFLLQTCLTDPGMLPKLEPDAQYQSMNKPRTKQVEVRGKVLTLKYDETYHFYRPPRAHHCSECHVVVEKFDHFCPWMGQTIGLRNYRPFVSFLFAVMLLLLATIGFCSALIAQYNSRKQPGDDSTFFNRLRPVFMAPILVFYCICFTMAVSGVLFFHIYLILAGHTTYEHHKNIPRVFGRGPAGNCFDMWCLPTPPPFVMFDQAVEDALQQPPPELIRLYNPPWCDDSTAANIDGSASDSNV